MIWDVKNETMPAAQLKELQSERLRAIIKKVYDKVPFYKAKMDEADVKPSDIRDISDLSKLPFTTKDEMRDVYPYGLLTVDLKDIVEIHTSSGTTGKPVVGAYTQGDIGLWSEIMARTLSMGGVTEKDVVQNAYGYGLFTGGLGAHYGIRRVGAACLPISGGNTKRQLEMMQDFGTTVLCCTPSYALYIAEAGREAGIDFRMLGLEKGFFGAEPWSENMRREIEARLHIKAYDIFGLTEIIGPGVAAECELQNMLHVFEDHFFPEIIDPATGNPVPDGQKGELVFTTLTKEGTPVIRYRTRDITFLTREPCSCGRTSVRMHRLLGRTDDMLIIRGVNVYPSQVEQVLIKAEGVEPHYQILVEKRDKMDCLEVDVEMTDELFREMPDDMKYRRKPKELEIEHALHNTLLVHCKVTLVAPKSIPRSEGKAKRIIDKRSI
ncbi:MAG: phenylacetate--CoA ligase [Chitinispirillales bacterium]|jgi:phenylacetate-CoA ligase|nr:phenylacetate--CoA ligase [Chitinispirillales bacterium]